MGWPVIQVEGAHDYSFLLPKRYFELSSSSSKRLSGNGMMMQQVMAWNLFVYSNCLRRDALQAWRPPLRLKTAIIADDAEEEQLKRED